MATDVVMPQMGESIAEGTVVRWIKKPGDKVERDEPLLEISTDKVDAEIPSPASGTLTEIVVQEGQTVAVNAVVARIATDGEQQAASSAQPAAPAPVAPPPPPAPPAPPSNQATAQPTATPQDLEPAPEPQTEEPESLEDRRRTKSSPLVRKIARENNIDITNIQGSGVSGRVTKNDILGYIQQPPPEPSPATPARPRRPGNHRRPRPVNR